MTDRKNMSIMELAYQILLENERAMTFNELFEAICTEKGINEEEKANLASQVYTDFVSSAKFIYVGDDEWDVKGRRAIDLWDKDGAYYDEYPDYEEELLNFEDEKVDEYSIDPIVKTDGDEEDEEESIYEDDFDEDDIEDDDSDYDDFEEDEEEFEEDDDIAFEEDLDEEDKDFEEEQEEVVEEVAEEDEAEEYDEDQYNEYMDDYEDMYED